MRCAMSAPGNTRIPRLPYRIASRRDPEGLEWPAVAPYIGRAGIDEDVTRGGMQA
jgi:hypothetical protein